MYVQKGMDRGGRVNFQIPEAETVICLQTHFKAINSYIYISWMCLLFQDLAWKSESDMTKQHCREPKNV